MNSYQRMKIRAITAERKAMVVEEEIMIVLHEPNSRKAKEIIERRKKQLYTPGFSDAVFEAWVGFDLACLLK